MKTLTVRQPWAAAFFTSPADRAKDVENRYWSTNHRGMLAIHAGMQLDVEAAAGLPDIPTRDRGVILGVVELTTVHPARSEACRWHACESNPWAQFDDTGDKQLYHWMVEHAREFTTPIKARGSLSLWEPTDLEQYLVDQALAELGLSRG